MCVINYVSEHNTCMHMYVCHVITLKPCDQFLMFQVCCISTKSSAFKIFLELSVCLHCLYRKINGNFTLTV